MLQSDLVVRQPIIDKTDAKTKELELTIERMEKENREFRDLILEMLPTIKDQVEQSELTKTDVKKIYGTKTAQEIDDLSHE
ncbi:MAG: hypothetical protein KGD67_08455 [Candidatus Lokiarchaeota archaeon]|nr:hypothetical protein [Candidatus Lokiarchaeota archaeon]